jgi:hypothetical protein
MENKAAAYHPSDMQGSSPATSRELQSGRGAGGDQHLNLREDLQSKRRAIALQRSTFCSLFSSYFRPNKWHRTPKKRNTSHPLFREQNPIPANKTHHGKAVARHAMPSKKQVQAVASPPA